MKHFKTLAVTSILAVACTLTASAQSWTPLNNQPMTVGGFAGVGQMLQLRDGRVLVHHENGTGNLNWGYTDWYYLTPDAYGSYVNGMWTPAGNLPNSYQPLYFSSQTFLNAVTSVQTTDCTPGVQCGQILLEGGEYNSNASTFTNLGEIGTYVPFSGGIKFTANSPPSGWSRIGDAASVILFNGAELQSSCCNAQSPVGRQNAIFNGPNSWITSGNVKQSTTDESGYTLLTNGKVLMIDTKTVSSCPTPTQSSELYTVTNPATGVGTWACGPPIPVLLYNSRDEELGAAVMMYNNKVMAFGGNKNATAVYDVAANTWAVGPVPAAGLGQSDGPAALEPNGKVLAMLSPGLFLNGCYFVEYDPVSNTLTNTTTTIIPQPADCTPPSNDTSYDGDLMILPTGQIMFTAFNNYVELYNPAPGVTAWTCSSCTPAQSVSIPAAILLASNTLHSGSTNNLVYGTQLNGLSQNNFYGDDKQSDTNFPLARLTCATTPGNTCNAGYVYYAFTHDDGPAGPDVHSIAPGHFGYTHFDLPSVPAGSYDFQTVTNGIPSNSVRVTVH
jgi:hypothetical protein